MAYGFEKQQAKIDSDVKLYLNENMIFEAWTMIIRHWEGDFDTLWEKLEQEFMKKSTKLTADEIESLEYEFHDYRRKSEDKAWAEEQLAQMGGNFKPNPTNINGGILIW